MPVEDYHAMTKMCKDQQNNNEQKKNLVSINFWNIWIGCNWYKQT